MTLTAENNRRERARFLRNRRERLIPAEVGIPIGPRRRSRGLRREEVALLAGLSPTWYTYLEQGRDIRPSPEVLDSLAQVLNFTEDERRYLHVLSYGQVTNPLPLETELPGEALLRQVVGALDNGRYPVYAANQYGDLLAWNDVTAEWYEDWGALPRQKRNILHWMLTSPLARKRLVDWEDEARDLVARWRSESAMWPDDDRIRDQVDEFSAVSPQFRSWWDGHDVREHRSRIRLFRHPLIGPRPLRIVPLQSLELSPAGIVLHLPLDAPDSVVEN